MGQSAGKVERTAREWLAIVVIGLLIAVLGAPLSGSAVAIGIGVMLIGGVGLAWRLLKDR